MELSEHLDPAVLGLIQSEVEQTRRRGTRRGCRGREDFESRTIAVIARGGGWVIKNVGDEVMFAAERAADAARIAPPA
ncbi:hypothetical protein GCM10027068_08520 [Prescottella soli]